MSDKVEAGQKCCAKIHGAYNSYSCGKSGKVQVNGKWYCGVHDPARSEAKRKALLAKIDAERQSRNAAADREKAIATSTDAVIAAARKVRDNADPVGSARPTLPVHTILLLNLNAALTALDAATHP